MTGSDNSSLYEVLVSKMKYAVLVGDGMSDAPIDQLNGKTPLDVANTPNMDLVVREGKTGVARTIPRGFDPGSYVGNLTLFGYNPAQYFSGRSSAGAGRGTDRDARRVARELGNLVSRGNELPAPAGH